ncbi:MAG: hypothetical protein NVS2B4_16870 [Ramlibacter sp.]
MPDIHIERAHTLGLPQARQLAFRWAQTAEAKFAIACTYEEGKEADLVNFSRAGVNGELRVSANRFQLHARLGFLLGAFKDRIEAEVVKNLDELLAQDNPLQAFDAAVDRHSAAKAAGKPAKPAKPAARPKKA